MGIFDVSTLKDGLQYNVYKPILKIDPNMRCAVMLIYGYKLAVMPFHEELHHQYHHHQTRGMDTLDSVDMTPKSSAGAAKADPGKTPAKASSVASAGTWRRSSYTIDLRKLDPCLEARIIDIEFLYGYYEPTLFVLCESTMTWVGR